MKREAQANGEHVITVGDFNGFQFSDGFVDVLGVTTGNPAPASQVITLPAPNLVTPNLIDLDTLQPAGQYSYVELGSAQFLDHILITQDLLPTFDHLNFAHIDADFPLVDENTASQAARISDHDPGVAYFDLPPVAGTVNLQTSVVLTSFTGGYQEKVTITNVGKGTAPSLTLTSATLGAAPGTTLPATLGDLGPNASVTYTLTFPASAGADHTAAIERLAGTYTGGNFSSSQRATLP